MSHTNPTAEQVEQAVYGAVLIKRFGRGIPLTGFALNAVTVCAIGSGFGMKGAIVTTLLQIGYTFGRSHHLKGTATTALYGFIERNWTELRHDWPEPLKFFSLGPRLPPPASLRDTASRLPSKFKLGFYGAAMEASIRLTI